VGGPLSTQETISHTSWALAYARRVASQRWRKAKAFGALNFNIYFRPTSVGKNVILDGDPAALWHAAKYFLKMFAMTLVVVVFATSQFKLYEGDEKWRLLVTMSVKLLIVVAIIYLLTRALPDRMSLSRLLQAALYVGGAYIIVEALLSIPVSYLSLIVPVESREVDIFETERERCLAHNSLPYWLLRGDMKFFLYSDAWRPADWAHWFLDNYYHVLAVPFLFMFARMLGPARKVSFTFVCLFAAVAFVIAQEGVEYSKQQLGVALAQKDRKCVISYLDQITKHYAPSLIARQISYHINNQTLKADHTLFTPVVVFGTDLALTAKFKPGVEPTWPVMARLPQLARQAYCSDGDIYWITARRINYRLLFIVQKDDTVLHKQLITPKDCPAWPSP
jgi:hypothetical protein